MWVLVTQTGSQKDYQHHRYSGEDSNIFIELFAIAEPSLGFSQNPKMFELKSLIMAQIERWRQA